MPRSPGQGSLFERLDPDVPAHRLRTRQVLASERVRAIKAHIERLLNSRQGGSQSCPGFGLHDFNDASDSQMDLRNRICEDIRSVVSTYETRVQIQGLACVSTQGPPTSLHFRLHCLVPLKGSKEQVEIDLFVRHRDRQIHVM